MSEASVKLARADRRRDMAQRDKLPAQEQSALRTLQREAKEKGAVLANEGKGGLPPSLVLGVLRRDGYKCKVHGDRGEGEHGGLTLHHKGGVVESKWLSNKGHSNDPNNIVTICSKAHDAIHEKARDEGVDSSQVTPKADKGDPRRDKGLPDAKLGGKKRGD